MSEIITLPHFFYGNSFGRSYGQTLVASSPSVEYWVGNAMSRFTLGHVDQSLTYWLQRGHTFNGWGVAPTGDPVYPIILTFLYHLSEIGDTRSPYLYHWALVPEAAVGAFAGNWGRIVTAARDAARDREVRFAAPPDGERYQRIQPLFVALPDLAAFEARATQHQKELFSGRWEVFAQLLNAVITRQRLVLWNLPDDLAMREAIGDALITALPVSLRDQVSYATDVIGLDHTDFQINMIGGHLHFNSGQYRVLDWVTGRFGRGSMSSLHPYVQRLMYEVEAGDAARTRRFIKRWTPAAKRLVYGEAPTMKAVLSLVARWIVVEDASENGGLDAPALTVLRDVIFVDNTLSPDDRTAYFAEYLRHMYVLTPSEKLAYMADENGRINAILEKYTDLQNTLTVFLELADRTRDIWLAHWYQAIYELGRQGPGQARLNPATDTILRRCLEQKQHITFSEAEIVAHFLLSVPADCNRNGLWLRVVPTLYNSGNASPSMLFISSVAAMLHTDSTLTDYERQHWAKKLFDCVLHESAIPNTTTEDNLDVVYPLLVQEDWTAQTIITMVEKHGHATLKWLNALLSFDRERSQSALKSVVWHDTRGHVLLAVGSQLPSTPDVVNLQWLLEQALDYNAQSMVGHWSAFFDSVAPRIDKVGVSAISELWIRFLLTMLYNEVALTAENRVTAVESLLATPGIHGDLYVETLRTLLNREFTLHQDTLAQHLQEWSDRANDTVPLDWVLRVVDPVDTARSSLVCDTTLALNERLSVTGMVDAAYRLLLTAEKFLLLRALAAELVITQLQSLTRVSYVENHALHLAITALNTQSVDMVEKLVSDNPGWVAALPTNIQLVLKGESGRVMAAEPLTTSQPATMKMCVLAALHHQPLDAETLTYLIRMAKPVMAKPSLLETHRTRVNWPDVAVQDAASGILIEQDPLLLDLETATMLALWNLDSNWQSGTRRGAVNALAQRMLEFSEIEAVTQALLSEKSSMARVVQVMDVFMHHQAAISFLDAVAILQEIPHDQWPAKHSLFEYLLGQLPVAREVLMSADAAVNKNGFDGALIQWASNQPEYTDRVLNWAGRVYYSQTIDRATLQTAAQWLRYVWDNLQTEDSRVSFTRIVFHDSAHLSNENLSAILHGKCKLPGPLAQQLHTHDVIQGMFESNALYDLIEAIETSSYVLRTLRWLLNDFYAERGDRDLYTLLVSSEAWTVIGLESQSMASHCDNLAAQIYRLSTGLTPIRVGSVEDKTFASSVLAMMRRRKQPKHGLAMMLWTVGLLDPNSIGYLDFDPSPQNHFMQQLDATIVGENALRTLYSLLERTHFTLSQIETLHFPDHDTDPLSFAQAISNAINQSISISEQVRLAERTVDLSLQVAACARALPSVDRKWSQHALNLLPGWKRYQLNTGQQTPADVPELLQWFSIRLRE